MPCAPLLLSTVIDFSADWPPGGQVGSCRLEKFQFVKASVSSSSSCVIAASIPLVVTKGIDFFFSLMDMDFNEWIFTEYYFSLYFCYSFE